MGNDASHAVAMAGAKNQLGNINQQLGLGDGGEAQKKREQEAQLAGVATKKEAQERRRQRELDYKEKQRDRAERKSKLSEQWAKHRQDNSSGSK
jgi:hypothetical protein